MASVIGFYYLHVANVHIVHSRIRLLETMTTNKQFSMFDCDDERANLFDNKSILLKVPLEIDRCLFWKKNNETITKKFEQLSNNYSVYLFISIEYKLFKQSNCQ